MGSCEATVADRPPPGQRGGCCRSGVDVAIGRRRADGAIWPDCDTPVVTQQPSDRSGRRISPDTQVRDMHGGGGGHTVDTVWTQSHLSRVSQGKAICAAQNGFSCLTRTTPNGSRTFASFRVVKFEVSAGQRDFWAGFDSRQLHQWHPTYAHETTTTAILNPGPVPRGLVLVSRTWTQRRFADGRCSG